MNERTHCSSSTSVTSTGREEKAPAMQCDALHIGRFKANDEDNDDVIDDCSESSVAESFRTAQWLNAKAMPRVLARCAEPGRQVQQPSAPSSVGARGRI